MKALPHVAAESLLLYGREWDRFVLASEIDVFTSFLHYFIGNDVIP